MIKVEKLNPFGRMCVSLGMLPSSYKESLTYEEQLLWFCNYLTETVIPTVNNNAEAVEELQALYTQLRTYVDEYFDNLDVQEEINNKLDTMVEDGTLDEIINQEIFGQINEDISTLNTFKITMETTTIPTINSNIASNTSEINNIENKLLPIKKENNKFYNVNLPSPFNDSFFNQIKLFWNGYDFKCDLNMSIEESGATLYIAPDGVDTNSGTYESPKKSINSCCGYFNTNSVTNGTIILKDGIYFYSDVGANITYPCTIKAEHKNKVYLTSSSSSVTFASVDGYSNTYKAIRSNTNFVVDLSTGLPIRLILKNSISEVNSNKGTYFIDGNDVYVHLITEETPTKNNCITCLNANWNLLYNNTSIGRDVKIYAYDLNFIGGQHPINITANTNNYDILGYFENCTSYFSDTSGAFYCDGGKMITKNCESLFSKGDGFDYKTNAKIIEINNRASYNGSLDSDTYNGSTSHTGSKVFRFGGIYHNNKGPNVADVQSNTTSFNVNCTAFDTQSATQGQPDSDFSCSQGNCTMYILNCYTKNSSSRSNLYNSESTDNNVMYVFNNQYNTSTGPLTNYTLSLNGYYII